MALAIETYTDNALSYLKLLDFNADMNIVNVELSDIVKKLIRKYRLNFISTETKLEFVDFQKKVVSDKNYLEIMIEQILNNALKYAAGKDTYIGFKEDYLYIKDTGTGISKEDIKMVFSRGYAVENEINPNKSSGIGLYLVSQISEKLNHRVEVDSKLKEYTEFRIYFE